MPHVASKVAVVTGKTSIGLLVAVLLLAASIIGLAKLNGLSILTVKTGSMRPAIRPGDTVLVRPFTAGASPLLQPGDIISFRSPVRESIVITHRVVSYNAVTGRVVTKGDALQIADPAFGIDRVIGTVDGTVPRAGVVFDAIRRPVGLVAMVYVPALALAGSEIVRLGKYYESRRYQLYGYLVSLYR